MIASIVRNSIIFLLRYTTYYSKLYERTHYTEIGFSGYVSEIDKEIAKKRSLKPLNRFERWLLRPLIASEQKRRRLNFQITMREVLGE